MKYIERDEATRNEDIRRAMRYTYRKHRLVERRLNAVIIGVLHGSALFFLWACVLALLIGGC